MRPRFLLLITSHYTFFCHLEHFLVSALIKMVGTLPSNHLRASAVAAVQSFLRGDLMKKLRPEHSLSPLFWAEGFISSLFWRVSSGESYDLEMSSPPLQLKVRLFSHHLVLGTVGLFELC